MATGNSIQMAKLLATPVQHVRSDEHGRVRRAWFEYPNDAAEALVAGSTINLCRLPPGARVMGGKMSWEANTGAATLAVGVVGSTSKYSAVPALLTAAPIIQVNTGGATGGCWGFDLMGVNTGGTMAAPVFGEVQTSPITIIGTTAGATLTANKRIAGYIDYLGNE
jgi:hypothetical protein